MNTHGGKGRNLPCDLHNEHVNRLYKQLIANMGALALVLQEQCPPLRGLLLVLRDRQASIQRQLITAGSPGLSLPVRLHGFNRTTLSPCCLCLGPILLYHCMFLHYVTSVTCRYRSTCTCITHDFTYYYMWRPMSDPLQDLSACY